MAGYSEKNIERFAGLLGIRKKPTPYIGPTDGNGLWTIFREPADNAVDQALAKRNNMVHLVYDPQPNKYWVLDDGEGIPVGKKTFQDEQGKSQKLSTFYVVTGLTHGGSNFSGDTISRGTHGIGIKGTNAMSKAFKVWTYRDKAWWSIEYKNAKLAKNVRKDKPPKLPHGIKVKRGTIVCFEPDLSLFVKGSKIAPKDATDWCELSSYLVPGLEVKLTTAEGKTKTWLHKNGPEEFIKKRVKELDCGVLGNLFLHTSKEADIAIAFTDADGDNVNAYTNGLKNAEGGEHVKALYEALAAALKPYAGKKATYKPSDLKEGVLGLVNYKISAPQFNNQPKDKLIDQRVRPLALPQFTKAWTDFFKKNKTLAKDIIARANDLRAMTDDFQKDKKLSLQVKKEKKNLSGKMADIQGNMPRNKCELFIVEGDSAGGTAKKARDKKTQAVFPLKGKPLNVYNKKNQKKLNTNVELISLLAGVGMDDKEKSRFGKYIFLTDADVDGDHIDVLLMGVYWKYLRPLIRDGLVYLVQAPEYRGTYKGKTYFGRTMEDVYKQTGTKNGVHISHLKGWGELNDKDLRECAMNEEKRKLIRIDFPKSKNDIKEFEAILREDTAYRKKLLNIVDL